MKQNAKKANDPNKRVTSYSARAIWTGFPSTIKWLQNQRSADKTLLERVEFHERDRGFNATIILLSAACLEGFLVECLNSYTIGNRFASKDTFEGRLDHAFLKRVSTAMFKDFPELFTLTLGKPLSELITDDNLIEGVEALRAFRNGIAHARPVIYQTCAEDLDDDVDYEMEGQYKTIHEYLEKRKLIYGHEDIFQSKIADHFAGLVRPYMEAVVPLLPVPQSDNVKMLAKMAFKTKSTSAKT